MAEKFTTTQFLEAIPNTGGVISAIASAVGCDWHTAKKYIEEHATVKQAWTDERNRITDRARHNIIRAIHDGDLTISKWWLQVMDEEFIPREKHELTGAGGGPVEFNLSQWKQERQKRVNEVEGEGE